MSKVKSPIEIIKDAGYILPVRCKDCKWNSGTGNSPVCQLHKIYPSSDWFCANGERDEMTNQEDVIETLIAIRKYFGYGQPSQTDIFKRYQQALSDAMTLLINQKEEIRKLKMFDEDRII